MTTPLVGTEWHELNGSGTERYALNVDGSEITRMFRCRWDHRYVFAENICRLGMPFPGKPGMICHTLEFEGVGRPVNTLPGQAPEYEECKVTAVYGPPETQTLPSGGSAGEDYATLTWSLSSEYLESGLSRTWKTAGTRIEEGATQAMLVPQATLTYHCVRVNNPTNAAWSALGKINLEAVPELSMTPVGHLLFTGAEIREVTDEDRNVLYDATYTFLFRSRPWNQVWRAARQKRDENGALMWDATTGDPVYVAPPAGEGGWDEPVPPLYESADFNAFINTT